MSSTSLAGSLVVPSNKPYCVHDSLQEENEIDFPEKEHSNVDYTLLDSEKMDPCKSTEFIEDNGSCAEDSEVSIEEDIDLKVMAKLKPEIETEMEDYHTVTVEDDDVTISSDSITESDQSEDKDGVENEDAYDGMVEDDNDYIGHDISEETDSNSGENVYFSLEHDKKSLNEFGREGMVFSDRNFNTGSASQGKNEIDTIAAGKQAKVSDRDEYISSLLEIKEDIEDIMLESHSQSGQNATFDNVARNVHEHVDGVDSVEKNANHMFEKDRLRTRESTTSIDAKSHIEINPELSQQYFHVDEFNGSEIIALEKSTVPKTPFHSVTNFDEDDEDEVPEL